MDRGAGYQLYEIENRDVTFHPKGIVVKIGACSMLISLFLLNFHREYKEICSHTEINLLIVTEINILCNCIFFLILRNEFYTFYNILEFVATEFRNCFYRRNG